MVGKRWLPQPGDILYLNFDPQAGHEQAGHRPALVVSGAGLNKMSSVILVCPITSQVKGHPFEVPLPRGHKVTGVVLAHQVKSVDWRMRQAKKLSTAPKALLDQVRSYLALILELIPSL